MGARGLVEKAASIRPTPLGPAVDGMLTVQGGSHGVIEEERCRELARLVGIPLMEG